jgi:mycothiol synthase
MGFTLRRFAGTDIDLLAHLIAAVEMADEGTNRAVAEIRVELQTAEIDLRPTGWLAQIDDGPVVGYNYVEILGGQEFNFWLRGGVHPAWRGRGIGRRLMQAGWTEMQRACTQMSRTAWVNAWADQQDRPRCRLLARFGLRPYHCYHEMERPAARVEPVPVLPPGVFIRPWDNRHCELAVALRNRAFAQNWGYQPTTAEALRRRFQSARYESPFSFTAWRRTSAGDEQMIGLVHGCLGWARHLRQANEGEIVWLAVAEEARGQGIGRALMLAVMNALREAGAEVISLGTDNYADRPAIELYANLGFTVRKAIVDYRGELQHGFDG